MYGWVPFVIYIFKFKEPRRACLISFLAAWLFLPNAEYQISGLPEYNKITATCYGIMISIFIFDKLKIQELKFRWFDLPITIFCFSPLFSSIDNGLGIYDGLSCSLNEIAGWGLPYLIGRIYFNTPAAMRDLAIAIIIGGLIYVPLCLIEIRMSPQLHKWFYGFHAREDFSQTMRYGGYRPTVFMEHGLMVGMWMSIATLSAYWMLKSKTTPHWLKFRKSTILLSLTVTLILSKSTGAIGLFFLGLASLFVIHKMKFKGYLVILVSIPILFLYFRASGQWDGRELVDWTKKNINEERAQSIEYRFDNEELIVEKARKRPLFGWGDWGRWRIYNDEGEDITISDSLWAIIYGRNGVIGLLSLYGFLLLPIILNVIKIPVNKWLSEKYSSKTLLSFMCYMYVLDSLLNACVNPFFALCAGASVITEIKQDI